MKLSIIKYNAGNIQSVLYALERIGVEAEVTDDHEAIRASDKVIFPGVGEASSAMNSLRESNLDRLIPTLRQPVLGICVGMQLLCDYSEENDTPCLGVVPIRVKLFQGLAGGLKVPQIGWNTIYHLQSDLFKGIPENSYVYYVHSYHAELKGYEIATSEYGLEYAAAIRKDNFFGVQFHAEKSADAGEQILRNFLDLKL